MIKKTSGKKELVKTIQKLLKEARTSRFDKEELDPDFGESDGVSSEDEFYLGDEDDYLRGDEDFHMYDNEQRIEDEPLESDPFGHAYEDDRDFDSEDSDRAAAESDRDERRLGEESLMEMAIIKRIILNRLIKEQLGPSAPIANPVASNGNGVEATLTKKKKLEEQSGIGDLLRNSGTDIQNALASKAGYPGWKPGMENDKKVQDVYARFMQSESKKLKEDRIDPITGKGAGGVQTQMDLKKKKAAEEKATKEGK